jgi:hypothetical protein
MLSIDGIIKKLWNAQGYGNLAVWGDGTMKVITPGTEPGGPAGNPPVIFKPIPLVSRYPMLDHALGDAALREHIGDELKAAGMETG